MGKRTGHPGQLPVIVGDNLGLARADATALVRYTQYIEQGTGVTVRGTIAISSDTPLIEISSVSPVIEPAGSA